MQHLYVHRPQVPKTMRAIAKVEAGPGLKMIEALVPTVGAGEVLVRVQKTSLGETAARLCAWDEWATAKVRPPIVAGGEFVGLVADVGLGVTAFHPGEQVVGGEQSVCGLCRDCLAGRRHRCAERRHLGVERDGALADYVCVPQGSLHHADPRIPGTLLACFDLISQAVLLGDLSPTHGYDVLILGGGPLGAALTAVLRHSNARSIVVSDDDADRLALAKRLGATRVVDRRREQLAEARAELGLRDGFGLVFEFSGEPTALHEVLANLGDEARVVIGGSPGDYQALDWESIVARQITLFGRRPGGWHEAATRAAALIHSGLDLNPLVTHSCGVGDFAAAFERHGAGRPGRCILDWVS